MKLLFFLEFQNHRSLVASNVMDERGLPLLGDSITIDVTGNADWYDLEVVKRIFFYGFKEDNDYTEIMLQPTEMPYKLVKKILSMGKSKTKTQEAG